MLLSIFFFKYDDKLKCHVLFNIIYILKILHKYLKDTH